LEHDLDCDVRAKLAFILGQIKRFDDAIAELLICIEKEPDNFFLHNSLAYTAYNSLYAAKNREIFLSGKIRKDRIALAHRHFQIARSLRQNSVTNFYREGMLYKQIEGKNEKALPLFLKAVQTWDKMDGPEKENQHKQRKNFIKSLYQGASGLLESGRYHQCIEWIKRCLVEDEKTDYISLAFKYYALGKIHFQMNDFKEARDALLFAAKCKSSNPIDFVYELLARTYLMVENPGRAMEMINHIPVKRRRPYIAWTESDVRIKLKDYQGARNVLVKSCERDNRSRHKTLIRLAKLEYLLANYERTMECGRKANGFFKEKWGNCYMEGLFFQALGAYRIKDYQQARKAANRLKDINPAYPNLKKLMDQLAGQEKNHARFKTA
jgi:tetratricopeptide (TPR) repeat protein